MRFLPFILLFAFTLSTGADNRRRLLAAWAGYVAEFIYFSNRLSFLARSNVMGYITNKYLIGSVVIE